MRTTYLVALVATVLAISACGGGTAPASTTAAAPPSSSPDATASGSSAAAAAGGTVEITIGTDTDAELKFDPPQLTVQAGTDVGGD